MIALQFVKSTSETYIHRMPTHRISEVAVIIANNYFERVQIEHSKHRAANETVRSEDFIKKSNPLSKMEPSDLP